MNHLAASFLLGCFCLQSTVPEYRLGTPASANDPLAIALRLLARDDREFSW